VYLTAWSVNRIHPDELGSADVLIRRLQFLAEGILTWVAHPKLANCPVSFNLKKAFEIAPKERKEHKDKNLWIIR